VTALNASQGTLISAGKDQFLSIFNYEKGEYQFVKRVALDNPSYSSALDILNGKILVGHDNGMIQTLNVDGSGKKVIS